MRRTPSASTCAGTTWACVPSRARPRSSSGPIGRLAWLASPLAFVMMLGSLNTSPPRYFVERSLGEAQLGIFTAIAYLIVAGETVVGAMGQSAGPRLARYYAQGNVR